MGLVLVCVCVNGGTFFFSDVMSCCWSVANTPLSYHISWLLPMVDILILSLSCWYFVIEYRSDFFEVLSQTHFLIFLVNILIYRYIVLNTNVLWHIRFVDPSLYVSTRWPITLYLINRLRRAHPQASAPASLAMPRCVRPSPGTAVP